MSLILARVVVSIILFCLPVFLFVIASRRRGNALYLLFPMFGAVPAILGALILFVPLEMTLEAQGLAEFKNPLVPLAGALIVFIFAFVMDALGGKPGASFVRLARGGMSTWGGFLVWSVLGAIWGGIWRSTEWLARISGLTNG